MITIENYSTHLPLLIGAVAKYSGPVIELGGGFYSTPVLHSLCGALGLSLETFETDREWRNRICPEDSDFYRSHVLDSWADLERRGADLMCNVAFIDCSPADMRGHLIDVMRRWARIIIIHDTETEQRHNYPGVAEAIASFKYQVTDKRRGPWTTAVSDYPMELERLIA